MSHIIAQLNIRASRAAMNLQRVLKKMHRAESGTTMTEFVIMLPVFLTIFSGVMILGEFTRKGTHRPIKAYKATFEKVLPFQKKFQFPIKHIQSAAGATDAVVQLATNSSPHNESSVVKYAAGAAETAAYGGLGVKGTFGESYARANTVAAVPNMKLKACNGMGPDWPSDCVDLNDKSGMGAIALSNGKLTSDITDVVGNSKYARNLLDDGTRLSGFSGGGGVLGMLSSALNVGGVRSVFAAGIRYGTVSGVVEDSYTFAGQTMDMEAHFNVLVPPSTQGPTLDAARAVATTRLTMTSSDHYDDLPGISDSQPLGRESLNVPNYR